MATRRDERKSFNEKVAKWMRSTGKHTFLNGPRRAPSETALAHLRHKPYGSLREDPDGANKQ